MCFCKFCCTSPVCLIYGACYAEGTFSYVFVRSYSPEDVKHPSLSPQTRNRTHESQYACPLCLLMVPANAQDARAALLCLLAVRVFLSACFSCSHVCISFCHFAHLQSFPISVFVCSSCELHSPGATACFQRGDGVIPHHRRWSFASGSVSLCLFCQSVLQLDSSCISGTVSFSFCFMAQHLPTLSGSDRYFTQADENCWRPLPFSFPLESVALSHSITYSQYSDTTC